MNNVAPPDALRRIHAALPTAQHTNAYGLTECGGVAAFSHPDDPPEKRPVTSGRPLPGIELQIRDPENGAPIDDPNTRGEIWMRGYCVFEGYYKDPVKNAECFDAEGWFNTGDLGALDEDGRVSFMGRVKDMLKVGGENVAALEIESYLQTHPAVNIAQVVGVPDDPLRRGPRRLRRARARRRDRPGRPHRPLPGPHRQLQGAPPRPLRRPRRLAHVGHQGPEIPPPRPAPRRPRRVARVSSPPIQRWPCRSMVVICSSV